MVGSIVTRISTPRYVAPAGARPPAAELSGTWGMTGAMQTQVIAVTTGAEERIHNLTGECEAFLEAVAAGRDGLLHVWVPHATAGLAVIETGAGSEADLLAALATLLPRETPWRHAHGAAGHGRDHVMPALVPPYASIPVLGGRMTLGTWQSLVLVDLNRNNPHREVRLSFLAG